jgi:uncharacterized protein (TIGR02145 family)
MKKLFLTAIALIPFWGWGQSVSVENTSVDYDTQTLTVEIGWAAGSRDDRHLDSVWVFVDYQPMAGDGTTGAWARATLTNADATAGTVTTLSGWPARGFFLHGDPSGDFASTLTLTLDGLSGHFNACVYASDYPPNATATAGGGYTLHGTPPFIINGNIRETAHTFAAGTCIHTITDSTGCPGFVVNVPMAAGEIASDGEVLCSGSTPGVIDNVTPAGGGDQSIIYSWYKDGGLISDATSESYTPPSTDAAQVGAHTYTRRVQDHTCFTTPVPSAGSWVLTIQSPPTIAWASGGAVSQSVTAGAAMTTIVFTTTGASSVTSSGLPNGVSGSWSGSDYTISGIPTVTGTYPYSLSTISPDGCPEATVNGTITVTAAVTGCQPSNIVLGTVGFQNSNTWVVGAQTWSAAVTATYCQKTAFNGGSANSYSADCRENTFAGGNFFSWCMVAQYGAQLCPSPWRVPAAADFVQLFQHYGLTQSGSNSNVSSVLVNSWGAACAGYITGSNWMMRGEIIDCWSGDAVNAGSAIALSVWCISSWRCNANIAHSKETGEQLRCVRD